MCFGRVGGADQHVAWQRFQAYTMSHFGRTDICENILNKQCVVKPTTDKNKSVFDESEADRG